MDLADDKVIRILRFLGVKNLAGISTDDEWYRRFNKLANSDPVWGEKAIRVSYDSIIPIQFQEKMDSTDDELLEWYRRFNKVAHSDPVWAAKVNQFFSLGIPNQFRVFHDDKSPVSNDNSSSSSSPSSSSPSSSSSSSTSSSCQKKFIAHNSMLQWSQQFHDDVIVISPDGKTASTTDSSNWGSFLSKIPLSNDDQSPIYFEVQFSTENGVLHGWSFVLGVQDISKSKDGTGSHYWPTWKYNTDHYIRVWDNGLIYRKIDSGPDIPKINDLKFEDGDEIGFVLHQRRISENNENEKENEHGFIAFYKNGKKISEDIKLTAEEGKCDFYAFGFVDHVGMALTIQDKPSFLPSLLK